MKKLLTGLAVAALAVAANASYVTVENGGNTTWGLQDFTTTSSLDAYIDVQTSTNYTENWNRAQSFTIASAGTIDSISVQALRLDNGGTFAMDVYESFDGDGSTYTGLPSKFRPWDTAWLNPVAQIEFTVDATTAITAGGVLTVNLEGAEQIDAAAGSAYAVSFRRTSEGGERLLWHHSNSDDYAGGAWGYTGQELVTGREFALGYTVIPEPATLGMVAVFGGGMLFIRRRFRI